MEESDVELAVIREQYGEILRRLERIDNRQTEQNGRVRKLEEFKWKATGVVAMALLGMTLVIKFFP